MVRLAIIPEKFVADARRNFFERISDQDTDKGRRR